MFRSVLVPVDVTVPSDMKRLLAAAQDLVGKWEATVHVVSVVPDTGMAIVSAQFGADFEAQARAHAQHEVATALSEAGLGATVHILSGTVYDQVIRLADSLDVDLILVGAHRPELKDYLLGSNAARMLRHSKKSVLVLRRD